MSTINRMGYEGQLFYGTAGSTGAVQITNCVDLDYNLDPSFAETTVRGNGSAVPIEVQSIVGRKAAITWKMINKPNDAALVALLAAAATGAAVAIRTKRHTSGLGFDGDCYLAVSNSMPLKGESGYSFTATPTDDGDRTPQLWV